MLNRSELKVFSLALALALTGVGSAVRAEDKIEKVGAAVGVTVGNMWFLPTKALSAGVGLTFGALSFLLSGGNLDLTKQIWQDTTQGPYIITPELAQQSVGQRPELLEKK